MNEKMKESMTDIVITGDDNQVAVGNGNILQQKFVICQVVRMFLEL